MRRALRVVCLAAAGLAGLTALAGLTGCGRKATLADCQLIVERNIEVELTSHGVSDPDIIKKRKEEILPTMKDDIEKCVGKHVSDGKLACVKTAQTSDEVDKCLR